jgi:hypothetical protein
MAVPRLALIAALVSCGGSPASATIEGVVLAGPQCPVVVEGEPCPDEPIPAVVIAGRYSAQAGEGGRFTLRVEPGTYEVTATSERAMSCEPQRVAVEADRTATITISCDTGIR